MQVKLEEFVTNAGAFGYYSESDVISKFSGDCNNCTNAGIYLIPPNTTHSGIAIGCTMIAIPIIATENHGVTIMQIFLHYNSWQMLARKRINGTWSEWRQLNWAAL